METALTVARALVALVAAVGFFIFWMRRRAFDQKLDQGIEKAKTTGDTSDVEDVFSGPPDSHR